MDVEHEERRCEIRFGGDVGRGMSLSGALDAEAKFESTTIGYCHGLWAMLLLWTFLRLWASMGKSNIGDPMRRTGAGDMDMASRRSGSGGGALSVVDTPNNLVFRFNHKEFLL